MIAGLVPQVSPALPARRSIRPRASSDPAEAPQRSLQLPAAGLPGLPGLGGPVRRPRAGRAAGGDEPEVPLAHGYGDQRRLRGRHRPPGHRRRLGHRHPLNDASPTSLHSDPTGRSCTCLRSLQSFHYHAAEDADIRRRRDITVSRSRSAPSTRRDGATTRPHCPSPATRPRPGTTSTNFCSCDDRPEMRSVAEPERPERVPGLVVESEQDLRALDTHQVRFAQTHRDIPIFGASAVVELTGAARACQRERPARRGLRCGSRRVPQPRRGAGAGGAVHRRGHSRRGRRAAAG